MTPPRTWGTARTPRHSSSAIACSPPASSADSSASTRKPARCCGPSSSGRSTAARASCTATRRSPIAFRETVIVPVGGPGKALMAFQQSDGKLAWAKNDFGNVYSSPVLIDVNGLEQLVVLLDGAVIGVNPHNGDLQWQVPFKADYSIAVSTPLWSSDNLLFVSAEYNAGSKVIELQRNGMQTKATELWSSNRLRLHHGNAMRVGDAIYFSSGGKGSQAILSAVEARSGKILWQERSIEKATFVWADQKLITLDQEGKLMIAHPSPQGFQIAAKAPLLTHLAWTPPVLVGTRAVHPRPAHDDGGRTELNHATLRARWPPIARRGFSRSACSSPPFCMRSRSAARSHGRSSSCPRWHTNWDTGWPRRFSAGASSRSGCTRMPAESRSGGAASADSPPPLSPARGSSGRLSRRSCSWSWDAPPATPASPSAYLGAGLVLVALLLTRNAFGMVFTLTLAAVFLLIAIRAPRFSQTTLLLLAVQLALSVFSRGDYLFTNVALTSAGPMPSDVAVMSDALFLPVLGVGRAVRRCVRRLARPGRHDVLSQVVRLQPMR